MTAFEVHLNGKSLCTAGIGEDGVLTALATWVSRAVPSSEGTRQGQRYEEYVDLTAADSHTTVMVPPFTLSGQFGHSDTVMKSASEWFKLDAFPALDAVSAKIRSSSRSRSDATTNT
jgi:hypothetical protein